MTATQATLRILLIDDDPAMLTSVGDYLKARGHQVHLARDGRKGLEVFKDEEPEIVITDIRMPGIDGFEVLRKVRERAPDTEVIMVTGYGEIDAAVQAMREGAFDFFTKPLKMRELAASMQRIVRFHALRQEKNRVQERLDYLETETRERYGRTAIVGESAAVQKVRDQIELLGKGEATAVLIGGETGTGKEMVARALHYDGSRGDGPFVAVDCASVPASLFESAFFGHEKGAFTDARETRKGYFELADGGTLFLDEIGDMAPEMQAGLLRVLEERRVRRVGGSREIPVDVRVVSATNRDLSQDLSQGGIRRDLYYRLNTFTLQLAPLRERPEDIPLLAEHFLSRYVREMRKPIEGFSPAAATLLQTYSFPGNVRELKNAVERAVIFCQGGQIGPEDLQFAPSPQPPKEPPTPASPGNPGGRRRSGFAGSLDLAALEKEAIQEALRRCGANRRQAAALLGISRFALRRRMTHYGLESDAETPDPSA